MLCMFYYNKKKILKKNVNSLNILINHLPHGRYCLNTPCLLTHANPHNNLMRFINLNCKDEEVRVTSCPSLPGFFLEFRTFSATTMKALGKP